MEGSSGAGGRELEWVLTISGQLGAQNCFSTSGFAGTGSIGLGTTGGFAGRTVGACRGTEGAFNGASGVEGCDGGISVGTKTGAGGSLSTQVQSSVHRSQRRPMSLSARPAHCGKLPQETMLGTTSVPSIPFWETVSDSALLSAVVPFTGTASALPSTVVSFAASLWGISSKPPPVAREPRGSDKSTPGRGRPERRSPVGRTGSGAGAGAEPASARSAGSWRPRPDNSLRSRP